MTKKIEISSILKNSKSLVDLFNLYAEKKPHHKLIKDVKTRFDHVRGDVESRELMIATLERAIEIIKHKE